MIDMKVLDLLNAPTKEARLANLREVLKTTEFPPMVPQYINNHIHTTYSFSPYSPTAAVYATNAWAMNYDDLRRMYEQWHGQVFKCSGIIVDVYENNSIEYLVMDVGSTDPQLLILENFSTVAKPGIGQKCTALADVTGRSMYQNQYYPMLAARYIYFNE